jgi:hypothetical protein
VARQDRAFGFAARRVDSIVTADAVAYNGIK